MSLAPLPRRRMDVLLALASSIRMRGYSPTARELGAHLGIRSTNAVSRHICLLESAGLISRGVRDTRPTWRSIRLTPEGEALLGVRAGTEPFRAEQSIERLDMGA
jgi:SOS-response transcriptional repressor LexA